MSATKSIYFDKVISILCLIKSVSRDQITLDSLVGADLGFDSIAVVDLWFELKKEFKHDLDISTFFEFIRRQRIHSSRNDFTVRLIVEYLEQQID